MLEFLGLYGVGIFLGLFLGGIIAILTLIGSDNGIIATIVFVTILMASIFINHLIINRTQTGIRMKKDVQSNLSGGLTRTIEIIEQDRIIYNDSGTFDAEIDVNGKIKYEKILEKDTQRVIILPSKISTVIIKEIKEEIQ